MHHNCEVLNIRHFKARRQHGSFGCAVGSRVQQRQIAQMPGQRIAVVRRLSRVVVAACG